MHKFISVKQSQYKTSSILYFNSVAAEQKGIECVELINVGNFGRQSYRLGDGLSIHACNNKIT